ncbi:MAG: MOSC N-terminal beta barrel domain-containing protein, partial [Actinomycetota bacterium]
MAPLRLTRLNVYPIKSAGAISADDWEVDDFGLRYDRRWMVVDQAGALLTQRTHPRLALVRPAVRDTGLGVDAPGMDPLELSLQPSHGANTRVTVWNDTCTAVWLGERAARWFSRFLNCHCRLVYMPDETVRPADPTFAPSGVRVSFADAFPFLLISE